MLFEEFQRLVNWEASYKEFEIIESIYNSCENMTKQDSAKIWKMTYGKEKKIAKNIKTAMEKLILSESDLLFKDRSKEVRDAIKNVERPLREFSTFTDSKGVTWSKSKWGRTPNHCYTIYDICLMVNGKCHPVGYRYF